MAAFAQVVNATAEAGDELARQILDRAGEQLASLAASVRAGLFLPAEPVIVVFIGGVFRSMQLRDRFRGLVEADGAATCRPPVYGPAAGALLEAYRSCRLNPKLTNLLQIKL